MDTRTTKATSKLAGTAKVLREMHEFARMEEEYGQDVAVSITAKAIQRFNPDVTQADVRGAARVLRALLSGDVSLAVELEGVEARAEQAAHQLFRNLRQRESAELG